MKLGKAFSDSIREEKVISRVTKEARSNWWTGSGRTLFFTSGFLITLFVLTWRLFQLTIIEGHRYRLLADTNRTRDLINEAPRGILYDRTGKPLVTNVNEGRAYVRAYPYAGAMAHVVGYVGEVSQRELEGDYYTTRNYSPGDRVGRMGAESVYNEVLRGRNGRELVEVDAEGTIVRSLGSQRAIAGEDVTLSLDAGLSLVAAKAFPEEMRGAVVISKPTTGEILALYSSPTFLPEHVDSSLGDPSEPLFNRAIGGTYPPGSTFKIVTALAALSENAITQKTTVEDIGVITIGPFTFPNWYFLQYGRKEGTVDIIKAIQRSNDIFFYKTGEWLGITKLADFARKVGIGKPLGIELGGEAGGLMPDPDWKNKTFTTLQDLEKRNNEWYLGDTYHVAIGQGYLLTTPLQVNAWTNVIANGGKLCRPTIQKNKHDCKDLKINQETIAVITEGMRKACEPGGTGWPLFNFKASVACKTGTAEFGDSNNRTHAWFTVFAPLLASDSGNQTIKPDQILTGEPEISITVLVEGAGEGSNVAAPIAKKILEEWFNR